MYLEKDKTLLQRDENGELISVDVTLELLDDKPMIKITPLTKGELQRMYSPTDEEAKTIDNEMILKHCKQPTYTEEELEFMKPEIFGAIKIAVLSLSTGTTQEDIKNASIKILLDNIESKKKDI